MYLFFYTFVHLYDMDVKEYLLSTKEVNLSVVAAKMYPSNKTAENYLYKKLHGKRPFTKKDAQKALDALRSIGITLANLTIREDYD